MAIANRFLGDHFWLFRSKCLADFQHAHFGICKSK
jgi:hypothetical protein